MKYEIREAFIEEKDQIRAFFYAEWKKSQILSDEKLFRYYYEDEDKINFVVAIKRAENSIVGACGYIKASEEAVWLSNLLVKKGEETTLVLRLIDFVNSKYSYVCCVNIQPDTKKIYQVLGYATGELKHFYKLFDFCEYKVACIQQKVISPKTSTQYNVIPIADEQMCRQVIDEEMLRMQRPYKSKEYVIKRYFTFPYEQYKYKMWGVKAKEKITTLIVTREQFVSGRKILRIVDVLGSGEELAGISGFWEMLGNENQYEYIDFWCYGVEDQTLRQMGFVENIGDTNIIPDRLEPLEQHNEKIFFFAQDGENFRAFRADCDMDRPNLAGNRDI